MEERLTRKEWYEKVLKEGKIFDIEIKRYKELFDLFNQDGYNLRSDKDFDLIKLIYFGVL